MTIAEATAQFFPQQACLNRDRQQRRPLLSEAALGSAITCEAVAQGGASPVRLPRLGKHGPRQIVVIELPCPLRRLTASGTDDLLGLQDAQRSPGLLRAAGDRGEGRKGLTLGLGRLIGAGR